MGVVMLAAAGCHMPQQVPLSDTTIRSLDGVVLAPLELEPAVRIAREDQLFEARRRHMEALVWYGRRTAYLGRYREALAVFTKGLEMHAWSPELRRHRGHRYITVRQFEDAAADLEAGVARLGGVPDEVEPDGLPNARGVPTTTLHFNLHYHLGLAHYLLGDWSRAEAAYRDALKTAQTTCRNPDALCAATYWLVLCLDRQDRGAEAEPLLAPIRRDFDIIENHAYHRLLLLFKGELAVQHFAELLEDPTTAYGVARWHAARGTPARGEELLRAIVSLPSWASFGFIAAEADLAR